MNQIHMLLILLFSLLHGGCPRETADSQNLRVVTQIQISATQNGETTLYTYTDSEDMERILTYLRLLEPYEKALIEPDTFRSDFFEISVAFSDGTHSTYLQIHEEYLQKNGGTWRRIVPKGDLLFPQA